MDEQDEEKGKKVNKIKVAIIATAAILLLFLSLSLTGVAVFKHYYSLLDYQPRNTGESWEVLSEDKEDQNEHFFSNNLLDIESDMSEFGEEFVEELPDDEVAQIEEELEKHTETIKEVIPQDTNTYNILLIGVDARDDSYTGRSDAMILVSINKDAKKIVMTSLLRDIYVSIPECGSNRLNAAYAYGGHTLLADTIERNFGIQVDSYVTVNFRMVMDAIDQIGGLDIDVSKDEILVMNGYIGEHNQLLGKSKTADILNPDAPGLLHLNGSQALAYSRVRYVGTDFARTGRQRTIINGSLEKVKGLSLSEMTDMMGQFLPRVRTDLTEMDCANLLLLLMDISDYNMESMTIPQEGTWKSAKIRGMSVLSVDMKANSKAWYEMVSGE